MPTETNYLWDYDNDSLLMETDGSHTATAVYTVEPEPFGKVIAQERGSTTSYYHYDALGSTRQLTDSTGTVTDTYTYDAWGEEVASTGATANPFRWVGQIGYYWDVELGSYSIRARTHESAIARWTATDPLDAALATYMFCENSPSSKADPSGLRVIDKLGTGVFTDLVVFEFGQNPEEWIRRVGSSFSATWKWTGRNNPFKDSLGNCCCDKVDFAQIVRSTAWYSNGIPATNRRWELDISVPYPKSSSGRPCELPFDMNPATNMTDAPNAPEYAFWTRRRLKFLRQEFETCAYCSGDGPDRLRQPSPFGVDATIYGCAKWLHTIVLNSRTGAFHYTREAAGSVAVGGPKVSATAVKPYVGQASSEEFKRLFELHFVPPIILVPS